MKSKIFLVIAALFLAQFTFAQEIREEAAVMSQGVNNAFILTLKNVEQVDLQGIWGNLVKDFKGGKAKGVKKSNELMADDVEIKEMSENTVDVYALIKEAGEDAQIYVWFDLGGAYLSSKMHQDRVPTAKKILQRYAKMVEKEQTALRLEKEEEMLKEMEKQMEELVKTQRKAESQIEDYKQKIAEEEAAIEQSKRDQAAKQKEIDQQKSKLESTKTYLKKIDGKR